MPVPQRQQKAAKECWQSQVWHNSNNNQDKARTVTGGGVSGQQARAGCSCPALFSAAASPTASCTCALYRVPPLPPMFTTWPTKPHSRRASPSRAPPT
eukprot:284920-Chlamydomonas_euryale.AAC.1